MVVDTALREEDSRPGIGVENSDRKRIRNVIGGQCTHAGTFWQLPLCVTSLDNRRPILSTKM